jgi:putative redox protein
MSNHDAALREGAVIVRGLASGFAQTVQARSHRLTADEPIEFGGVDSGPTPYELLLSALGT